MDWSELVREFLPIAVRLIVIIFSTLGVVYMTGRLLFTKLKDRGKNIIAFFSLIAFSFLLTFLKDYPDLLTDHDKLFTWNYLLDSFMYASGGCVLYIVIGWRFYSRVDYFLDKKFGKDDKRRQ